MQIPGPYDKDSDPEDVGKEGGLDNVWYQPSKGILIKMVLWPMTLELEAQCQELKGGKGEQCGQQGMAPTVCSTTGTVIRGICSLTCLFTGLSVLMKWTPYK